MVRFRHYSFSITNIQLITVNNTAIQLYKSFLLSISLKIRHEIIELVSMSAHSSTPRQVRRPQHIHNQNDTIFRRCIERAMLLGVVEADNLILNVQFNLAIYNKPTVLSRWYLKSEDES
jgi:hypothetical protein